MSFLNNLSDLREDKNRMKILDTRFGVFFFAVAQALGDLDCCQGCGEPKEPRYLCDEKWRSNQVDETEREG